MAIHTHMYTIAYWSNGETHYHEFSALGNLEAGKIGKEWLEINHPDSFERGEWSIDRQDCC